MYSWHIFRKDNPNTWPKVDCPMLVCKYIWDGFYELKIMYWDQNTNSFYYEESMEKFHYTGDELYYQYIGYIPNGYKAIKTKKCNLYPDYLCEYVDDGYCFDAPEDMSCQFCQEVTEYSLNDNKRIWKEFN